MHETKPNATAPELERRFEFFVEYSFVGYKHDVFGALEIKK